MTNGELFIKENPNTKFKLNGSCVWIYFYDYNHYTMPVEWWNKEIDVLDKIRAEIDELQKEYKEYGWAYDDALEVIDKYRSEVRE